jgi:hypothetical protein
MKKSIKNLETKAVKNIKAVKGGNNDRDFVKCSDFFMVSEERL